MADRRRGDRRRADPGHALQRGEREHPCRRAGRAGGPAALLDLLPLFAAAAAIRALLDGGVVLGGGLGHALLSSSLLAALVNNLPAAAAIRPQGVTATWAAILGLAIGPDLVITGSLATLISRRIARDHGAGFSAGWFSLLGAALLPLQLAVAAAALHLTGALLSLTGST